MRIVPVTPNAINEKGPIFPYSRTKDVNAYKYECQTMHEDEASFSWFCVSIHCSGCLASFSRAANLYTIKKVARISAVCRTFALIAC